MNELSHEEEIREEGGVQRSILLKTRIPTPIPTLMPKQKLN